MSSLSTASGAMPDQQFWQGKRVLLTGHTGFKGSWLTIWLCRLGARVTGLSLEPESSPNLHQAARVRAHMAQSLICDIRDAQKTSELISQLNPDIVFHLAAQPLVRESYRLPRETFETNIMGTAHVLDALRGLSNTRVAVIVTTDKVYSNREWSFPYRENDQLGGHDPYSASKAACELITASYRLSFLEEQGVAVASARAGNVIGGGDWSRDRLIPDAVRAWQSGQTLLIRRPDSIRPWQHVLEPLNAYIVLAQRLWAEPSLADAYNIGPDSSELASVRTISTLARAAYGKGDVIFASEITGPHEAGLLALETAKARSVLNLAPRWPLRDGILRTMHWYRDHGNGMDAADLCHHDISAYEAAE